MSCTKASLDAGASAQFQLTVRVACATPNATQIVNAATAHSDRPDPAPSNNTASVTTTVSNPAPEIVGLAADPAVLWPPNHQMVRVSLTYTVTDNCEAGIIPSVQVASDQPINGTGDGDTAPDWDQVTATRLRLRAERAPFTDPGRTYTITLTAADSLGSSSTSSVNVSVPMDASVTR